MHPPTAPTAPTARDGRHDFDFLFGTWSIQNRRLSDPLDPACDEWATFPATARAEPVLGGLGNVDRISAPARPGGGMEALTLRLYEPATDTWRIWWTATTRPGRLDPPVAGRFTDGHGRFEGDDELGGGAVRVRFEWSVPGPEAARWAQAFSFDGGGTWHLNWVMDFARTG
jgi:hypothetical protein